MLTKITLQGYVDTERQDKFLKEAIERIMTGDHSEADLLMVKNTFASRFSINQLGVSIENQKTIKQWTPEKDKNLNPF